MVFLGTASCFPTPTRGVSCLALQWRSTGEVWLFDCGEGSQVQLQRSNLRAGKVRKIFITHLHGDHVFGLPGLLCTLGNGMAREEEGKEVHLYGPLGIKKLVATCLELSQSPLPYRCRIHEMVPRLDQFVTKEDPSLQRYRIDGSDTNFAWTVGMEEDGFSEEIAFDEGLGGWRLHVDKSGVQASVVAAAIVHRVPSFGFLLRESDAPGSLDVGKAASKGLKPGKKLSELKAGRAVLSDDGRREVRPEDVVGPTKRGRRMAILGDTSDASEVAALSEGMDLLVHEATMENALREKAVEYGHSTPAMAAEFAIKVGAKRLCLTHLSPRYLPMSQEGKETDGKSARIILQEARSYMIENAREEVAVEVAEDFFEIEVSRS